MVLVLGPARGNRLLAQTPTAAIEAIVSVDQGDPDGVEVEVTNRETGFATRGEVRRGRFLVSGLEIGGPYSVLLRRVGLRPATVNGLFLSIGQHLAVRIHLESSVLELPPVTVVAGTVSPGAASDALGTIVSDSEIHRLPSRNRDLYDFVALNPHVSTRFGVSVGGVNGRYNSFLIDGANAQGLHGRAPAGAGGGGKLISIEAVKEYQVLVAPYDVSLGDFAGGLVSAVTRSGTNTFRGSMFVTYRNESLARDVALLRSSPYDQTQFGGWLGGPILRNRIQFFVAAEVQRLYSPITGPFLGQPASRDPPLRVGDDDLTRFQTLLTGYHLVPGSAGPGTTANPLLNLFGRVDVSLPSWNSRLVLRHSFGQASAGNFSRGDPSSFPLSSFLYQQRGSSNVSAVQLLTSLPDGGSNELSLNYYVDPIWSVPALRQPEIDVAVASADGEGTVTLTAGMAPFADAFAVHQHSFEANDVARVPMGRSHLLTLGGKAEVFSVGHNLTPAASGWWTFDGLDAFAAGNAATFTTWKDFGGGSSSLSGSQVAVFAGDQWQIGRSLSLTGGIRAELPILNQHPPYSPEISAAFGRGSEVMPRQSLLLSPRLGFTWNPGRGSRSVLRGGVGVFTGRPPFALWLSAFDSYGRGVLELDCAEGFAGPAPHFDSTYAHAAHPPQACANGVGFDRGAPRTAYLLDPSIKYPQSFRASLAYERSLWRGGDITLDALYSRMMNEFFFVDRALKGPTGTDAHGRVIYGTFDTTGKAYPDLVDQRFVHAVDMVPQRGSHSWEMSIGLTHLLSTGFTASAAYTHSRVRDAMTMTDPFGFGNLDAHPVAGRVEDQTIGVSDFDLPHRVLVAGTFTAPWKRWRTDVSIFYTGGSGAPFTLTTGGGRADLNADGNNFNDPIYIPRDVDNTEEIAFDGTAEEIADQRAAFGSLIANTECLARQRGRIMARNSCRGPWVNSLNLSLRQTVPAPHSHGLSVELEIFNMLNLLHAGWGSVALVNTVPLSRVAEIQTSPAGSTSVFQFDTSYRLFSSDQTDSYYQIQLAARYSF